MIEKIKKLESDLNKAINLMSKENLELLLKGVDFNFRTIKEGEDIVEDYSSQVEPYRTLLKIYNEHLFVDYSEEKQCYPLAVHYIEEYKKINSNEPIKTDLNIRLRKRLKELSLTK